MPKILYCLLSVALLLGCSDAQNKSPVLKAKRTSSDRARSIIKPECFATIPDEIDGCGEYYTYDTCKAVDGKYIFLSNLSEYAFIRLKGKKIRLERIEAACKEINDKSYISVYKGKEYEAVLKVKQTSAYDEGGFYTGTLQISHAGETITFKVHGQTGC